MRSGKMILRLHAMIVIFLKKKLNFLNIYARFAFASGLKKASESHSKAFQSENYMFFDFFLSAAKNLL